MNSQVGAEGIGGFAEEEKIKRLELGDHPRMLCVGPEFA